MVWTGAHKRLVATYTVVHGLGEFLTALTLFSLVATWNSPAWQVLAYNVVAFGGPIVVAVLVSRSRYALRLREGPLGLVGAAVMAAGLLTGRAGWVCVLVLGAGSALLHIAAGTATLKVPGRPGTAVGLFESSGAFGLALGGLLGVGVWTGAALTPWIGVGAVALLLGGLAVLRWGTEAETPGVGAAILRPDDASATAAWAFDVGAGWVPLAALGGLAAVSVVRSVVGGGAPMPWKEGTTLVLGAALAVAFGRALGGILADRWGLYVPAVFGLVGAGFLLAMRPDAAWAGLAGSFCLALPMAPVILGLLASLGRPSLAFGLAQLFQVPAAAAAGLALGPWALGVALLLSAGVILWLHTARRVVPESHPGYVVVR